MPSAATMRPPCSATRKLSMHSATRRGGEGALAAPRLVGDPRRLDDGGAEEVVVLGDGLAGAEADAHAQGLVRRLVAGGEGPLDGDGAVQGAAGGGESGHEAVAHGLHLR